MPPQPEPAPAEDNSIYRAIFENSRDAIIYGLPDGTVLLANPAAEQLLGYSEVELKEHGRSLFINPADERWPAALQERAETGTAFAELSMRRKDGCIIPVEVTTRVFSDAQGGQRAAAFIRDISQRKQAEQAQRQRELRLLKALETSYDAIYQRNFGETGFAYLSPSCESVIGYSPQEMAEWPSDHILDLVHPDDLDRLRQLRQSAISGAAGPFSVEYRLRRKDGSYCWLHDSLKALFAEDGKLSGWIGTVRDISASKAAEQALAKSEASLQQAQRIAHMGSWEWDPAAQSISASPENFRLLGIENKQAESSFIHIVKKYILREDRPKVLQVGWQGALNSQTGQEVEFRVRRPDGEIRWIHATSEPVFENDKLVRILGVNQDITEQKHNLEQLEASLKEKEILLREVHHRVKNNLASIIGLVNLQRSDIQDPRVQAEFDELRDRIQSMASVHDLLYRSASLAHIDMQAYFERLAADLKDVYDAQDTAQLQVEAQGVEMEPDLAIPCGLIVTELVTNIFKYAFPAGLPRPGQPACLVRLRITHTGGEYTLSVSDNGVGLPAGLDWQKAPSLGLRLVRMLGIYQLRAEIQVDSTAGLSFTLRFEQ